MKSLLLIHSAAAALHSETPPKLKPFKLQTLKMSRVVWRGVLSLAAIASVLSIAPNALAVLQRGDAGTDVSRLQRALGISADGIYGSQTETAVLSYQRRCGLQVDGIAGNETLSSLAAGTCYLGLLPGEQGLRPDDGGSLANGPYVVVVPGDRVTDVSRYVASARLDDAGRGIFVNAGSYGNRSAAEEAADRLKNNGFPDARVDFRP